MAQNICHYLLKSLLVAVLSGISVGLACTKNSAQTPPGGGPQAMPVKVIDAKAVPVHDTSEYVAALIRR